MNRLAMTAVAAAAALAMSPVAAQAQLSQFQLVRPGDGAMTCEALATEINALSAGQEQAARKAESGRKLRGFASQALSLAGPMLGGGLDGQSGLIAQQAMGALQAQAMQQQMTVPSDAASAMVPAQVQRMARLSQLYAAKGC